MSLGPLEILQHHTVHDKQRGTLSVVECGKEVPFEIKRVFYLYDLPDQGVRANHAHRMQSQYITCLQGELSLNAVRGHSEQRFILSAPDKGIYIPPMTWISIKVLSTPAVCMVLCSGLYDENDYIRNFEEFQRHA